MQIKYPLLLLSSSSLCQRLALNFIFPWEEEKEPPPKWKIKEDTTGLEWHIDLNSYRLFSYFYWNLSMKAKSWTFYTSLTREKSGMINAFSPTLVKLFWSMGTLLPGFSWSVFCSQLYGSWTTFILVFGC